MNIINKNKDFIAKHYSNLNSVLIDSDSALPYQYFESRNGSPNVMVEYDGDWREIYSKYNPQREAEMWLKSVMNRIEASTHILLIGFGLGYHLKVLLDHFPSKKLYIYEPDIKLFSLATKVIDLSTVLSNENILALAVGDDETTQYELIRTIANHVTGSFIELTIPFYSQRYLETISMLRENSKILIRGIRANLLTLTNFSKLWVNNIFENFDKIIHTPSLSQLKDKCADIPAVIVGSGPSLHYDIEILKQLKNKVLIIAAGTSTQALLHAGIEPDLIVSIDGGEANFRAFSNIDTKEIPFIFGSFIHPKILKDEHQCLIHLLLEVDKITPSYFIQKDVEPIFNSTYSVTGTCIQVAAYLGCKTIAFTGQDLSYPDKQYYAHGVNHTNPDSRKLIIQGATELVKNVQGSNNPTTNGMYVTLKDIEFNLTGFPDIRFINSSQNGAIIRGTEYLPLNQCEFERFPERSNNWFANLFQSCQPPNKKEREEAFKRIVQDKQNFQIFKKNIKTLRDNIASLTEANPSKRKKLLVQINQKWMAVCSMKLFKTIISSGLDASISNYMRHVPNIVNEKDEAKKCELICEHLGALVEQIAAYIPAVEYNITQCIQRIQKLQE